MDGAILRASYVHATVAALHKLGEVEAKATSLARHNATVIDRFTLARARIRPALSTATISATT